VYWNARTRKEVESDAGKKGKGYASCKGKHSYLKSQTEEMTRARKRFRLEQHEEQPEAKEGSSDSSTSEVGLPRPQTESENNLKLLLESQNRSFLEKQYIAPRMTQLPLYFRTLILIVQARMQYNRVQR